MAEPKEIENIRVAVRCRPMNDREIREQAKSCFTEDSGHAVLTNLDNPNERHEFGFDYVYGTESPQAQVFEDIGVPILTRAFGGYNGTIFAYGQTGSGKTFSMTGVPRGGMELEGLIPRMNKAIFTKIQEEVLLHPTKSFLVECSYFEIYNEIIYDLLDGSGNKKSKGAGLEIKEHSVLGIYVKDLQERVVENSDEVGDLMAQGAQARTVGATQMNAESSRSHSIFVIKIHQKDGTDESKNIYAKINLVDLAGSERAASTGAQGDRLKEGANINKSLSALGNVINTLVEVSRSGKKLFVPYRNSKLTRVLQESLGGNSLCSMLATCSPANINFPETLSTLKYASRAKSIKVQARKNETSSQISQLNEEIANLKKKLLEQVDSGTRLADNSIDEKDQVMLKYEKQIQEMERVRLQTWEDKAKLSKHHQVERKRLTDEKAIADRKVEQERTRRWKLLQEKNDLELAFRTLRDLDLSHHQNDALESASLSSPVDSLMWLEQAERLKRLESGVRDHRTLILVFKDSLDRDVSVWSKRERVNRQGPGPSTHEIAARHMLAGHIHTKLKNIRGETQQLFKLETEWIGVATEVINMLMSALHYVRESKERRNGVPARSKCLRTEDAQFKEEISKGLIITLSIMQKYRDQVMLGVRQQRDQIFATKDIDLELKRTLESNEDSEDVVTSDETGDICRAPKPPIPTAYSKLEPMGSLGRHEIPEKPESAFTKTIDFDWPHFFHSMTIRVDDPASNGADSTLPTSEDISMTPKNEIRSPLRPTIELQEEFENFLSQEITGEETQVYAILALVMSWKDLLKSNAIPSKLFSRPPIRFLHDIIRSVVGATGFAESAISTNELKYQQLPGKLERAEFLTKILDFVQATYNHTQWKKNVIIAATASNIMTGKQVQDTMQFLGFFGLAALAHVIAHPREPPSLQEVKPDQDIPHPTKETMEMKAACSHDGGSWQGIGAFTLDLTQLHIQKMFVFQFENFDSDEALHVGRYLRLEISDGIACSIEVNGQQVAEKHVIAEMLETEASGYGNGLQKLVESSQIVVERAKILLERSKESEREKLEQQKQLSGQLEHLKLTKDLLEKEKQALSAQVAALQAQIVEESRLHQEDKKQADSVAQDLQTQLQAHWQQSQTLETKCQAHEQAMQQAEHDHSELVRELDQLRRSKENLENLCHELRDQLQAQERGTIERTEEQVATQKAELLSANVLVDELRRNLAIAEQNKKEQEQIRDALHANLTHVRQEMIEQLAQANVSACNQQKALNELLDQCGKEKAEWKAKASALQTQVTSAQDELTAVKHEVCQLQALKVEMNEASKAMDLADEKDKQLLEAQTKELHHVAEIERLEAKATTLTTKQEELSQSVQSLSLERDKLRHQVRELKETDEELTLQIQVLTEERDTARQNEELLFTESIEKDQEIERIRDGYVWVTDRMNAKEDELAELQEQLERYQSLMAIHNGR
uniref:Kinesinlike protein putative n=1 Tax=Albugo laibachii Nc14 TaxID=890382 RepID=F0VZH7_9STRA|nr:kinesinlike protein putative [Albugo laibachii Nc14]|eukprot:CCA14207.1 kinesinlike protein putative [Albugo laibachii Nc14]